MKRLFVCDNCGKIFMASTDETARSCSDRNMCSDQCAQEYYHLSGERFKDRKKERDMRIIKQGSPKAPSNAAPVMVVCQDCGLEAELESGEVVAECPCCGSSNITHHTSLLVPSEKKPFEKFPAEYYHFVSGDGRATVAVSDAHTVEMIRSQ